ncbi:MAG: hypothetical protein K2J82_01505 [Muribaculaceae bacterium]|nr:hypothetical protein [Muribaculaceae bacterium]
MNKYLIFFSFFILSVSFCGSAQNDNKFIASFTGGIYINNEQAWILEPAISLHFNKYFGVGMGMEFTCQYNQPVRTTVIDNHEAALVDNERNVGWIIFKPHAIFKSPAIWKSSDNYLRLWLQAEPGVSLACPFRNSLTYEIMQFEGTVSHPIGYMVSHPIGYRRFPNKGLQWFYWNAKVSADFAIDRFIIEAGYGLSNLDYYSGRRNITLANGQKFYVPKKELSQSVFISLGYSF